MKILVTGHRGFIGSNLYSKLKILGFQVDGFEWGEKFPGFNYDVVMHIGAISSTEERNVEKIMRQNYDFSTWLLEACNTYGIDFQYSSSASVYGLNNEFNEESPVDPRTPYAWSKYMFERYTQSKVWNIKVQGFRYFNVYGKGEDHKGEQASPYHKFSQQIKQFNTINLFEGSENYLRDFVPVEQVVDTHIKFLDVSESGIWNVGTGKPKSFLAVADELAHTTTQFKYFPMPKHMLSSYQKYTCANMEKMERTIKK